MVRTQIQLTERQSAALKRLSRETGDSIAELIRRSVDRLLATEPSGDSDERKRRAIEALGSLRSGRGDLSENHNDYLAEAYRG
jgi:hypothetical protein